MGTTGLNLGRSGAVRSRENSRDVDHQNEKQFEAIDDNIEDGPIPWWSGIVWLPLLILSLLFLVGLAYALSRLLF